MVGTIILSGPLADLHIPYVGAVYHEPHGCPNFMNTSTATGSGINVENIEFLVEKNFQNVAVATHKYVRFVAHE